MYKVIEKELYNGLLKAAVYYDKALKQPYLVYTNNAGAECTITATTPQQAYSYIKIFELKELFTIEELSNPKNYKTQSLSNKEVWEINSLADRHGGKREGAGRPKGTTGIKKKTQQRDDFREREQHVQRP